MGISLLLIGLLSISCQPSTAPKSQLEIVADSLQSTLSDSPDLLRGYEVYRSYGCILCHGVNGEGGVKNSNAQTAEQIPAMTYVAEGFTVEEFNQKVLKGVSEIAKLDPEGQVPPFVMPAWPEMSSSELNDLRKYVWNLYPEDEEDDW